MENSLTTNHLSIGYANHTLLSNLNLQLTCGQLICFMGPNGIGKSTLIRTLAGLQPSLAGEIKMGAEGKSNPEKLSVVLTEKVTATNMTVQELVTLGRYPYLDWTIKLREEDFQLINKVIALTNIQHLASRKLYELSDGQLQMAMIARALAQNTPIILLDEPTAHLDLNNRVEIMNLLRNLTRQENKAILVSTHELDLALQMADSIWLAGSDKSIRTGIPEDLVLDGSFDEIFKFKGFDLKTGKVFHESFRNVSLQLSGYGHEFLWTKNALERTGFTVTEADEGHTVRILKNNDQLSWKFQETLFHTIADLIRHLEKKYS
jgi:iron complex transport system ATP-binding protein